MGFDQIPDQAGVHILDRYTLGGHTLFARSSKESRGGAG
jgi:hypothetical protein